MAVSPNVLLAGGSIQEFAWFRCRPNVAWGTVQVATYRELVKAVPQARLWFKVYKFKKFLSPNLTKNILRPVGGFTSWTLYDQGRRRRYNGYDAPPASRATA